MEEIDTLKHEGIDHRHPKFQEWKKEARSTLKAIYGEGSPVVIKFDELDSSRRTDRMWEEEHDIKGKRKAIFKMDMDRAKDFLAEALKVSQLLGEEGGGIDEEAFISTVSKGAMQPEELPPAAEAAPSKPPEGSAPPPEQLPPKEVQERKRKKGGEGVGERRREQDITELLQELEKEKRELERMQLALEEALDKRGGLKGEEDTIEGLLLQLEAQIKDPDVEMREVQRTMEELLRLKGKKALLQRLAEEIKDPTVPWGRVRGLMRGVWEIDRKYLIDILPDLLAE